MYIIIRLIVLSSNKFYIVFNDTCTKSAAGDGDKLNIFELLLVAVVRGFN